MKTFSSINYKSSLPERKLGTDLVSKYISPAQDRFKGYKQTPDFPCKHVSIDIPGYCNASSRRNCNEFKTYLSVKSSHSWFSSFR